MSKVTIITCECILAFSFALLCFYFTQGLLFWLGNVSQHSNKQGMAYILHKHSHRNTGIHILKQKSFLLTLILDN